jgi:hypothetical protein
MVTKHPVMHPGDVRMLLGVDVPELRDHKNVILFSQHGLRPEAHKMAGSDLDGDQFAVTWDERLFLKSWNGCERDIVGSWVSKENNRVALSDWAGSARILDESNDAPMAYDASQPGRVCPENDHVEDKDLVKHFISFIKADNLGRIAMMWQDYAAKNGANCSECLALAALHSIAVDFAKSGIPAMIPRELIIRRDVPRAHWRERAADLPYYHCTRIIGQLFDEVSVSIGREMLLTEKHDALAGRRCSKHGEILCFASANKIYSSLRKLYRPEIPLGLGLVIPTSGEEQDSFSGDLFSFAMAQRWSYEDQIVTLMNKYHLHSEGEMLTGCIRKYHSLRKRRRHEVSEEVRRQCAETRREHRREFFRHIGLEFYPDVDVDNLDEEREREHLDRIEIAVLGSLSCRGEADTLDRSIRAYARKLAAAYYMVTYNPEMRWRQINRRGAEDLTVLFSFPWVVADVIDYGMHDRDDMQPSQKGTP